MTEPEYNIPDEVASSYEMVKYLPKLGWCGVQRLMFHATIHTGIDDVGYQDRWCIASVELAKESLDAWDGTGEPLYWHKHPGSRTRRNPVTDVRWHEDDIEPTS